MGAVALVDQLRSLSSDLFACRYYRGGEKMSKTNCVNCGAAKDASEIKCPFCGTTYLDLTAIDFASGDPVVCQFVLPDSIRLCGSDRRVIMSMLAVPQLEEISMTTNTVDVCGGGNLYPLAHFTQSCDVNVNISFKPVLRKNSKKLCELRVE